MDGHGDRHFAHAGAQKVTKQGACQKGFIFPSSSLPPDRHCRAPRVCTHWVGRMLKYPAYITQFMKTLT